MRPVAVVMLAGAVAIAQDWTSYGKNELGWRYSELDQINPQNVKQLQLAWVFATGAVNAHEAAPLVNNGVMYVSAPGNQVFAIDAKAGTLLWRYRRDVPPGSIVMHPVSRGVALFGDRVYFASSLAVLVVANTSSSSTPMKKTPVCGAPMTAQS